MDDHRKELLHGNNLVLTWLGDVKKALQREQTRLRGEGVDIRMKPIWQAIHDGIWAAKQRHKEIQKKK